MQHAVAGIGHDDLIKIVGDYQNEELAGERLIANLVSKKAELHAIFKKKLAGLEDLKQQKDNAEEILKGTSMELASCQAQMQAKQAWIKRQQEVIEAVKKQVQDTRREEEEQRESFKGRMLEFNRNIIALHERHHQFAVKNAPATKIKKGAQGLLGGELGQLTSPGSPRHDKALEVKEVELKKIQDELLAVKEAIEKKEQEYSTSKEEHKMEKEEALTRSRHLDFVSTLMGKLQDLAQKSAELERGYNEAASRLQKNCICLKCGNDNFETLHEEKDDN